MAATGNPPAAEAFLARPLELATRAAVRFPYLTVVGALLLAALALLLTVTRLGYKTSRIDLLDPQSDYNRLWLAHLEEFGEAEDAVVVVEGTGPQQVVPVLDELAAVLATEERLLRNVLGPIDLTRLGHKGLHYLRPQELAAVEGFIAQTAPIVSGAWSQLGVGAQVTAIERALAAAGDGMQPSAGGPAAVSPQAAAAATERAARLAGGLVSALRGDGGFQSPWPALPAALAPGPAAQTRHLLVAEGRLGMVLLQFAPDETESFTRGTEAVQLLRRRVDEVAQRHPEVQIGVTGLPVMENDEMRSSEQSTYWASLISLAGVGILFVAGFGGLRHALLANLVLLVGMAWSFGYVTLAVGHLNILSMSFAVTLIGIGIDYGIHFVARYLQLRGQGTACAAALVETGRSISPAIMTGAVTTAIAFFAAGLTSFRGVAELGVIAGGGILLCAVAELLVLPAVLVIFDRGPSGDRLPEPLPIHTWTGPLLRRPRLALGLTLLAALAAGAGLPRLWYDPNLLHMQPAGLESVEWEHRLMDQAGQSVWYALSSAASREELLARKAQFAALPSVERTEEIVSLLPADDLQKRPLIERIHARLGALPERAPLVPVDRPEQLDEQLARLETIAGQRPELAALATAAQAARQLLRGLTGPEYFRRVSQFQQQLAEDLLGRLRAVSQAAEPEPPTFADLPPALVARFYGKTGRHMLKVYGRGDIWDVAALERFVGDVRAVDPRATGNPLQTLSATGEMRESYERAALYALVVILTVLVLDFRSVRYALLAALPLALGMVQMFGLLGWLDLPLNPANLIALPLILGIGVDYGVHIVHDYREQQGPYRISPSTAVAVMVDSLTTIVGFGALMIASHQGLASLGRVLTIGVSCCLFTSFLVLPALLTIWSRRREPAGQPGEPAGGGEYVVAAIAVGHRIPGALVAPDQRPDHRTASPPLTAAQECAAVAERISAGESSAGEGTGSGRVTTASEHSVAHSGSVPSASSAVEAGVPAVATPIVPTRRGASPPVEGLSPATDAESPGRAA